MNPASPSFASPRRDSRVPSVLAHLPQLDGLRGVAVLLVIWAHFPFVAGSTLSEAIWKMGQALRTGYIGVDLFFVLSGFLITRILLDERVRTCRIDYASFYLKRVVRIFPIYYFCVFIDAISFPRQDSELATLLPYTFNYYKPFHPDPGALEHTWSLSVEEQFYLIWPFVIGILPVKWGKPVTGLVIPIVALLAALLVAACFENTLAASIIYMSGPTRMMSLSLGACIAFGEIGRHRAGGWQVAVFLAGGAVLVADNVGRALHVVAAGGYYWSGALVGYAMISFATVAFLIDARHPVSAAIGALLSVKPLRYIGKISYGLYLYHYLILFLLGLAPYQMEHVGTTFIRAGAALLLTFATAGLSYRFVEQPFLAIKGRMRSGAATQPG